jgi:hypothetical protein
MTRQRLVAALTLALALAVSRPAAASEEEIHAWKRVTVAVTTGADFGEVEVTAERAPPPAQPRLTSLTVTIKGKKLVVPAAVLKDAPPVALESLAVHSERGYDKHPWLYAVFKVTKASLPAGAVDGWVYFAFQDGKLRHRSLKTRDAKGQYKFEQTKLGAAPQRARAPRAATPARATARPATRES